MNWVQQSEEVTDLYLYDYISHEKSVDRETGEAGPEITAQEIIDQLAAVPTQEIVVHINSGGGDATEGVAIAQALKDARGRESASPARWMGCALLLPSMWRWPVARCVSPGTLI